MKKLTAPRKPSTQKEKVLFVCHGNINRSAAAHIIAKQLADPSAFAFYSVGVKEKAGGEITSKRMRDTLARHGFPTKGQRSVKMTQAHADWADTIFYMDTGNLKRLSAFNLSGKKVVCLAKYAGLDRIKDPAFSGQESFDECVCDVKRALQVYLTSPRDRAKIESGGSLFRPGTEKKARAHPEQLEERKAEKPKKEKKPFVPMPGHMSVLKFGRLLIETNDLDPIYVMLHEANLSRDTLKAWCLAYSCFYHAGVASKCAEDPDKFWENLRKGHDEMWPRGSERRHFRGHTSEHVTTWLGQEYATPVDAVNFLVGPKGERKFTDISTRVRSWKYFGPW